MSDGRRPRRVAEGIRALLSTLISREFSDPNLEGLVVTKVEVPPDLTVAYVGVRLLVGEATPSKRARAVRAAQRAAGRLRKMLGAALQLKRVPELRFNYDTAPDDRARVEELLAEIDRERGSSGVTEADSLPTSGAESTDETD